MEPARRAVLALLMVLVAIPALNAAESDRFTRRRADFPTVRDGDAEYAVLRGDFHLHTPHSDGHVSPRDRITEAWREGYDVISITDHRGFKAYEEALPLARELDVLLVRGMETGVKEREHFLALGFSEDYEPRNPHEWAVEQGTDRVHFQEQMQRLADAGGFVVYAHPHVGFEEPVTWGIEQGILQGIEVKNAGVDGEWGSVQDHGTDWYPFALDRAMRDKLTVFANTDAHHERARKELVYTLVLTEERSVSGVMQALREGRTLAWFNDMVCARQDILTLLVNNVVDIAYRGTADGETWLWLNNRSPLPLEATVDFQNERKTGVSIGPEQQVLVPCPNTNEPLTVTWDNLWIESDENLVTTHEPASK